MLFTPNIVPGQGFVKLHIYEKDGSLTATGRPKAEKYKSTDREFYGIISTTTPIEQEEWRQSGHPVTHKIVQHTAVHKAKATDMLLTEDGRCFYIQGPRNPGGLNVTMVYMVEERNEMYEHVKYMGGSENEDNQPNPTKGS